MPSPVRAARLRLPSHTPVPLGPGGTSAKDLILVLKVSRIQKNIMDGAQALALFGFTSGLAFSYSIIQFKITLTGVLVEDRFPAHSAHPVATGTEHVPDYIDLEEAAMTWNHKAEPGGPLARVPQLEIDHDGTGFRVYKGLIQQLELTRREGRTAVDFSLIFDVAWSETSPILREWA